jgi:hypothetical protein
LVVGYRVGRPEVEDAARVINFEVTELSNAHIISDAARALDVALLGTDQAANLAAVLAEIEKRFGPGAVAMWTVQEPEWAIERYGPGVVYRVVMPEGTLVISDLGHEGQLRVWRKESAYMIEAPKTLKSQLEREQVRMLTNVVRCLRSLSSDIYIIIEPYMEGLVLIGQADGGEGWGYCHISKEFFVSYEYDVDTPRFIRASAEFFSRILSYIESEERVFFETDWNRVFLSRHDLTTRTFDLKVEEVEPDDEYYPMLKRVVESPVPRADVVYARIIEASLTEIVHDLSDALGKGRDFDGGLKLNTTLSASWGKKDWLSTTLGVYGYSDTGHVETDVLTIESGGPFRVVLDAKAAKAMNDCLASLRRDFGKTLVMSVGKSGDGLMLNMEDRLNMVFLVRAKAWPDVFEWERPAAAEADYAAKFEKEYGRFGRVLDKAEKQEQVTEAEREKIVENVVTQAKTLLAQVKENMLSADDAYAQIKQLMDAESAPFKPPTAAPPTPAPAPAPTALTVEEQLGKVQRELEQTGELKPEYLDAQGHLTREGYRASLRQLSIESLDFILANPDPLIPDLIQDVREEHERRKPAAPPTAPPVTPTIKSYADLENEFKGLDIIDVLAKYLTNYYGLRRDYLLEDLSTYLRSIRDKLAAEDLQRFYKVYPRLTTTLASIAGLIGWIPAPPAAPTPTPTPTPAPTPAARPLTTAEISRLEDLFRATLFRLLGRVPRDSLSEFRVELETLRNAPVERASKRIEELAQEIADREMGRAPARRGIPIERAPPAARLPSEREGLSPPKAEPPAVPLDLMSFPRRISSAEESAFYQAFVYEMYQLGADPEDYKSQYMNFRDARFSNWFAVLRAFEGMVNDIKTGKAPRFYPRPPIWHTLPRDAILHLLATKVYKSIDQLIAGLSLHGVYVEPDEIREIVKKEWANTPRDSWLLITPKEYLSETLGIPLEELPNGQ